MYQLTDDALTVAIIDEHARTLHAVLEGSPEELPRFAATVVRLSREDLDASLVKVPGGGPGDTPGVVSTRRRTSGRPGQAGAARGNATICSSASSMAARKPALASCDRSA